MKIYLVRHGESEHNVDRVRMAHTHDSKHALTERGRAQVEETAKFLGSNLSGSITVISSPYQRTMETANAIRRQLPPDIPFYENPLLREWELGNLYDFQNRSEQSKTEFKAAGPLYFRYVNGESLADVYLRAGVFLQTKLQKFSLQGVDNVVVVTHAAFLHMMLAFLMDWPMEKLEGFRPIENAAVIAVEETGSSYTYEKVFVPSQSKP